MDDVHSLLTRIAKLEAENAQLRESLLQMTIMYTQEVSANCDYDDEDEDECDGNCEACRLSDCYPDIDDDDYDDELEAEKAFDRELARAQLEDAVAGALDKGKKVAKKTVDVAKGFAKKVGESEAFKSLLDKGEDLIITISKKCTPDKNDNDNN